MPAKYQVLVNTRDDDSYMYSSSSFTYYVVSEDTGDELAEFHGSDDQNANGRETSGVRTVVIEGSETVATHYDGQVERHPLPTDIQIVDGGKAIDLTWADGRVERRPRKEALAVAKFGQVYSMKPLVRAPK